MSFLGPTKFFHVFRDDQIGEVKGYRLVKTFRDFGKLNSWLHKQKRPLWIIYSDCQYLPVNGMSNPITIGGFETFYHSPQYGSKEMHKMFKRPIFNQEEQ